ncbi:adenylyl-sulfate kinase [Clostridium sp. HCP1S3_B4]|uniref:adenylyl-sulfate kinase n=1 Tax=unclassified Clostridium TaxID=2614128 RepID=UPI003F88F537
MRKGFLYWITGLSGSGKTTIGNILYYKLKQKLINTVILDGDILKGLNESSVGYTYTDRKNRARLYSNICKILVDQGINVIICTIAMFDDIRDWNRENIDKYIEVFLDVDMNTLKKRNKKELYSGKNQKNVAGLDVKVEFPKNPDIIIKNDGRYTVEECVDTIMKYPCKKSKQVVNDVDYWNNFYKSNNYEIAKQSSFANYILKYTEKNKKLIDLGCGNGRDSKFFASKGIKVYGVDSSEWTINKLNSDNIGKNCIFICDDFVSSKNLFLQKYDYCYSRFTLHAINEKQENELLFNIKKALNKNGYFFVEARTINDEIYGKGRKIGRNEYIYEDHYRRFINVKEFKEKIESVDGLKIIELDENKGYSKLGKSDPTLMRCIIKRVY